jgi:hypothetical protein
MVCETWRVVLAKHVQTTEPEVYVLNVAKIKDSP